MTCLGCDPSNIFLYADLSGLFTGAAIAGCIRAFRSRRAGGPGISAVVPVYFSGTLLSVLAGYFFGGGYPGPVVWIPFGIIALLTLMVGLFRRVAGIIVFIFSAAVLLSIGFNLRSWVCVSPDEEILELELISADTDGLKVQTQVPGEPMRISEINQPHVILQAEVLLVHPAWFFIHDALFVKITVGGGVMEDDKRTSWLEKAMLFLPGFRVYRYVSEEIFPVQFVDYRLYYSSKDGFSLRMND